MGFNSGFKGLTHLPLFAHGHWPIISFVVVIFFIIWTTEEKWIHLRDTFKLFLFDWYFYVFFGILILSTWSSLFLLHCAINYYFPLILVVLCIICFMPMTSSNRSERKISLTIWSRVQYFITELHFGYLGSQ